MSDQTRLGAAVGDPVPLEIAPFRYFPWPIVLPVLGVGALGLAAFGASSGGEFGGFVGTVLPAALGAVCLVACVVFLIQRPQSRGSLTLHENGFLVIRGGKRTELLFAGIDSLAVRESRDLGFYMTDPTDLMGRLRRVPRVQGRLQQVTLRGAAGTFRFSSFHLRDRPSPVSAFLGKLIGRLADAAESRLQAGGALDGRGWSLGSEGLRCPPGGGLIPFSSLARAGVYRQRVSLWLVGADRAFFSVRSATPNALVLGRLVSRRLRGTPEAERPGELGRVLFEMKSRGRGLLVAAAGILYAVAGLMGGLALDGNLLLLGVGAVGLCVAAAGVHLCFQVSARHEHGLAMRSLFDRREILFTDVERMSYGRPRFAQLDHAALLLKVWSASGKPVTFEMFLGQKMDDLAVLAHDLAKRIAAKLQDRLAREGEVPWTAGIFLTKEGVRKKRAATGNSVLLTFAQQPHSAVRGSWFELRLPGHKRALLRARPGAENFYPGLVLFKRLAGESLKAA